MALLKRGGAKKIVGGRSFGSRNPLPIGAIGLVVIAMLLWAAFNAQKLPIIGGGTVYSAAFTEAAGLAPGDEVRIAGVKVGQVESVSLQGTHVAVDFRVKNAFVGNASTAAIDIKTVLGRKYLAVDSTGTAKQDAHSQIPTSRTTAPYDIYPALSQLTDTLGDIDTTQLAKAFETLAATFQNTPATVKQTLNGLERLSTTVASRDQALQTLLARANDVTTVLASRDAQITSLLNDGSLLFQELNLRRDAISQLLTNTSTLSVQISGLVADNQATLGPALAQLNGVLKILQNNRDNIDKGLALLAPFVRVFTNTLGNGRWFDAYIQNLSSTGLVCIAVPVPIGAVC